MNQRHTLSLIAWGAAAWLILVAAVVLPESIAADETPVPVGAAQVDVTPAYPVRLSGYSSRRTESTGIAQRIWARALAIGGDGGAGPAVMIAVDNCGVPGRLADDVAARLHDAGVRRERLVVCSIHPHSAPWLTGYAPFLAGEPVPREHEEHRARYTAELADQLVAVARQALQNRQPARLFWTRGQVAFAANRRVMKEGRWTGFGVQPDGAVDHQLPVLVARTADGRPLAVWVNYACHCTTLGGDFYQVCGDWAGYAAEYLGAACPGAVALISIGCGADANPEPRGKLEMCQRHGRALADEVVRLLKTDLRPVSGAVTCRLVRVELPFGKLPTRDQWSAQAQGSGPAAVRARHFLERLERGEELPKSLAYPIATWAFGDDLAMVFLGGEVVVDYALRLRSQFRGDRLWITAYANDMPCYLPSQRILREGGYEADSSMIYYGQPGPLAPQTEDAVVDAVRGLLPSTFQSPAK